MRPNDTSAPGLFLFLALPDVLVPHDRPSSAIDTKLTVPTLRLVTRVLGLPQVLRAALEKKGHLRPELRAARFLGKEAYRPASRPTGAEHQPTGRKLPGHWRGSHWRRQAFGEGSLQRKLIWIQPHKTAGPDA